MIGFRKILFPTDFSLAADRALRHAIRLAHLSHGEVIVQHVVSNYFDQVWNSAFDLREVREILDRYVKTNMAEIVDEHSNMTFRQVISKGRPAEEIVALADEEQVGLIVMGSADGAITGKVIRLARQPVLAISTSNASGPTVPQATLDTILVATDLSAYSAKIIEYAAELKEALGARLYILHVIETPGLADFGSRSGEAHSTLDKMKEWAGQKMIRLTPSRFASDQNVIRMVDTGPISDRIAAIANDLKAGITIVGTHEYGDSYRLALGTTTDALLSKTSSPVLALRL